MSNTRSLLAFPMPLVAAMIVTFGAPVSAQSNALATNNGPGLSIAAARHQVEQAERVWARARVKIDQETFQRMLASDFYAQLPTARLSREQFIHRISNPPAGTKLTRFDNSVLTLQQDGDTWVGIIVEKLEFEHQNESGDKTKEYWLAVTRDSWKQFGGEWKALFSEVVGLQKWSAERPPIKGW
jgi:hypothetical protein